MDEQQFAHIITQAVREVLGQYSVTERDYRDALKAFKSLKEQMYYLADQSPVADKEKVSQGMTLIGEVLEAVRNNGFD